MKGHVLLVLIVFAFVSCSTKDNVLTNPSALVPNNTTLLFKINASNEFKSLLKTNLLISELVKNDVSSLSNHLDYLNPKQELLITTDTKNNNFTIITTNHTQLISLDSTKTIITSQSVMPSIFKTINKKDTLYHRTIDSLFFGSNNLELVKSIEKTIENLEITELLAKSDKKKSVSVIFKNNSEASSLLFLHPNKNSKSTGYSIVDFNLQNKSIQYNGITKDRDSLHFVNSFRNTIPQDLKISKIIPENTSQFKRIAFDDFTVFSKNHATSRNVIYDSVPSLLNLSSEISEFTFDNKNALALYALDADILAQTLITSTSTDIFREIPIYNFDKTDFFAERLKPFLKLKKANYFFVIDNFAVFAETAEILKAVITSNLNDNTLNNVDAFKNLLKDMADDSSYFIYKNNAELSLILPNTDYNTNAVQFIFDTNFAHVNASFKNYKAKQQQHAVTEHFSVSLPDELLTEPQTVKNHITNANDIVVQDVNNMLYLISNSGSILWKKQLNGKILGNIEQIDSYKNGRLQLAFTTQNKLYVIDRNGNDVGDFPLNFKDNITQPLSVFDYDTSKNYRLLVTQGKSLIMYDVKGKKVNGFSYTKANKNIITQPNHFRLSNKDYIVFAQGEKLEIINRQGQTRINVKERIKFSGNPIFLYQNQFTTTNTLGELVQINTKGEVSKKELNLSENHKIESTSKTLVSLSENKLKIRSKSVDLDYGDYTNPRIFYLNDKIYISTTDKQAKKVFVFDSQAKLLPNFPVFGISGSELQNMDKNSGIELITTTDSKTVTVYKLH